jgi:hypothetical protein
MVTTSVKNLTPAKVKKVKAFLRSCKKKMNLVALHGVTLKTNLKIYCDILNYHNAKHVYMVVQHTIHVLYF